MTARDSAPPHSDRNPAVAPRVRKANSAFNQQQRRAGAQKQQRVHDDDVGQS